MSTKTNEAIVLNATIAAMKDRMSQKNALLSVLTEDKRDSVYADISQIAGIIRGNSVMSPAKRKSPIESSKRAGTVVK